MDFLRQNIIDLLDNNPNADPEDLGDEIMALVREEIDAITDQHLSEIRELEASFEDRDS